ncbi:MAG: MmgE/PrpD family protein [Dehalococcoidales bacterium]|nr:MmgE/PrpD family protein [Dehalococcoidales bacterium]
MTNIGSELSSKISDISYDDLPQSVVHKIKQILLDSIGCALGSVVTDRARISLELISEFGGNPQAVIIGGGRTSLPQTAFVNAELIHALCYEACGLTGHIVPYVLSPILAIAERKKSSCMESNATG